MLKAAIFVFPYMALAGKPEPKLKTTQFWFFYKNLVSNPEKGAGFLCSEIQVSKGDKSFKLKSQAISVK